MSPTLHVSSTDLRLRMVLGTLFLWTGIDYLFNRDLSPFYSYFGAIGVGVVDNSYGMMLAIGGAGVLAGPFVRWSGVERFSYLLVSIGCVVHGLGFWLMQFARWVDANAVPTAPVPLDWFSQFASGMLPIALGVLLGRVATWPELRT